jgi:hypothetical protein
MFEIDSNLYGGHCPPYYYIYAYYIHSLDRPMQKTPIPLYRQGNTISPRMDNVRINKDVATFEESGVIWVLATLADTQSPGGISTFSNIGRGNNWWKIEENIDIPPELKLINDHDNHWLWQPGQIMTIDTYRDALKIVGAEFSKIN